MRRTWSSGGLCGPRSARSHPISRPRSCSATTTATRIGRSAPRWVSPSAPLAPGCCRPPNDFAYSWSPASHFPALQRSLQTNVSYMPKTDDLLGPGFAWRLRAALDRVQPPHDAPRYLSVTPRGALRTVFLRAAPAVAVGVAGLMLTAYAATGSPNPVIWTQNAASAITSITHAPEPIPTAEPSSAPRQRPVRVQSQ